MAVDDQTRGTRAEPGDPTADGDLSQYPEAERAHTPGETIVPTVGSTALASLPAPGYQLGELIGRGGMGEVVVAQDQRIGREVAVKRIRAGRPSPDTVARFLREARIQARLDHPAIVPVYELGTDEEGRPYFTMKRVAGKTLARKLADHEKTPTLLRAFVDVCMAIELAHKGGVIHRDLKPSNIMLGDHEEVYVLDWGVARVLTDRKRTTAPAQIVEVDDGTTAGAILGTPGYMAPEQIRGLDAARPADVYALGCILFEILTGEPLHPRGDAALATTLTQPQVAPAKRAQEKAIAPELDIACFDALAEKPEDRPSANELGRRVRAYLDGDRDLERRRAMAAEQLASAHEALTSEGDEARATAMRRAGRALALDPESQEAAGLVTSLILEPPTKLPPDLIATLEKEELVLNAARSKAAMYALLFLFAFWPILPSLGIKNWTMLLSFYGLMGMAALLAYGVSRTGRTRVPITFIVTALVVVSFTRIAGPFILTPIVVCAALFSLTAIPAFTVRPWLVFSWTVVAVMSPFVLEWIGAMDRTYLVKDGFVLTASNIFDMSGRLDDGALVVGNLLFLITTAVMALTISQRRRRVQRSLLIKEWHLRQLLPATGRPWQTNPTGTPRPKLG